MTTIADAALAYARKGWKPVPMSRESKKAIGKEWQKRPFSPEQFNGNSVNVGIQLGKVSAGLVDVDLDSTLAIGLAPEFLPKTAACFGRRSKPCSHQLYVSDLCDSEKSATIQYKERGGAVIAELRIGAGNKGATSIVPPSMHVTGEMVEWVYDGDPARVDGNVLKHSVLKLAVTCLLHPHYPGQGSRHEGALVLGGVLARAGWGSDDIEHVVGALARAVGDDEPRDRVETAIGALEHKANGHDVAGLTRLAEIWGEDVAAQLAKWLGTRQPRGGKGGSAGIEDATAIEFAAQHAELFRYVPQSSQWRQWCGSYWRVEETLAAFDQARRLCRLAGNADAKTVAAVVNLARSDRRIAATMDQWDVSSEIFNTVELTIELKTGIGRTPRRKDYCTKIAACHCAKPGSPHPLWDAFLNRVANNNGALIDFLQRFLGYCMTGCVREHVLVFLYGRGANGKSVFLSTVTGIFNDYAITAPMEMFLTSKYDRHPTEIARLHGVRLVVANETARGRAWDEAKIKNLTGGDKLSGRFMRCDFFDFAPTHKLLIAGNYKPSLRNVDEATRRRFLLVPFTVQIPENERDPELAERLKAEWPAILRWMADGCLEYFRIGLKVPTIVREATDQYLADQDIIARWAEEWIEVDPTQDFIQTRTLFASWKHWCEQRNFSPGTEREFSDSLADQFGSERARRTNGRGFKGIDLKPDDAPIGQ